MGRWALTILMVTGGILHFVVPDTYVGMMPKQLAPYARELVDLSGVFEILGGLGLILPGTRRLAAWGIVALLVAVFPANINMAIHHLPLGDRVVPLWTLYARLPLQLLLIWWAYRFTRPIAAATVRA